MKTLWVGLVLVVGCAADTRPTSTDGRLSVCEYSAEIEAVLTETWDCLAVIDCGCGMACVEWLHESGSPALSTSCGCDARPLPASEQPPVGVAPEDCGP